MFPFSEDDEVVAKKIQNLTSFLSFIFVSMYLILNVVEFP